MERQESKYLVIKNEDLLTAFKQHDYSSSTYHKMYDAYYTIITAVESIRYELDKPKRKYVVISDSNPEMYKEAWKLIEKYEDKV